MIRHRSSSTPIVRPGFSRERAASLSVAAEETPYPATLDGLFCWLDAHDLEGTLSNNDEVLLWEDKSGNGRHATAVTGATAPFFNTLGPHPRIQFSSDWMTIADLSSAASNWTFCFHCAPNGLNATHKYLDVQTGRFIIYADNGSNALQYNYGATAQSGGSVGDGASGIRMFRLSQANGATVYYITESDANLEFSGTYTQTALGGANKIGAHYDGTQHFYPGYISEVIIYNRWLSNEERDGFITYVAENW